MTAPTASVVLFLFFFCFVQINSPKSTSGKVVAQKTEQQQHFIYQKNSTDDLRLPELVAIVVVGGCTDAVVFGISAGDSGMHKMRFSILEGCVVFD